MKTKIQCPDCDEHLERKVAAVEGTRKGETFTVQMDALVCPNCGFKTVPRNRAAQFALRVANEYRKKHGLLTSMEIKDLRSRLDMTQKQFTDFLGAGEASVKRWELGEIQSRAMDRLMRLAAAERLGLAARQYEDWGGFEQLEDRTAVQLYRPNETVVGMPHGPPYGPNSIVRIG